jgi:osmoprotectant transport system ATP-binding protein
VNHLKLIRSMNERSETPLLALERVTQRFGSLVAVDSLTLRCETGRTTALLGPSGCGKSTLLRMAVGLIWPTEGEVLIEGQRLDAAHIIEVRRRIGYVIQEGGLFPHLDVFANVTLMARHLRWDGPRIRERFEKLRELVKLPADVATRFTHQLSGGQRQRVSLMRALMLDPPLLLLDEPLGALDPMIRRDLQRDLAELFAELRKTVVLVTHDIAEAGALADTLVLLRAGRIVQRGTLADLIERPASQFVSEFVETQRGAREVLAERRA